MGHGLIILANSGSNPGNQLLFWKKAKRKLVREK